MSWDPVTQVRCRAWCHTKAQWPVKPRACRFRASSSETSQVSSFLHHLEGVQSKLLEAGHPGL